MSLFGKDFEDVQVGGEFKSLPAGGYICRILKARATTSSNGLPMIEAPIDIIDGDYTQYFSGLYRQRLGKDPNAKYPYHGVLRITTVDEEGMTKKNFKSFCTSVERSNDMILPRHDEAFIKALKDKEVGVIFGREEYIGNDGNKHWSTKPRWFASVESIQTGDYQIPEDTLLPDTTGTGFSNYSSGSADTFDATSDSIPF